MSAYEAIQCVQAELEVRTETLLDHAEVESIWNNGESESSPNQEQATIDAKVQIADQVHDAKNHDTTAFTEISVTFSNGEPILNKKYQMKRSHDNRVTCDVCGRSFHDEKSLKGHIFGVHEFEKKNQCQFCGRYFERIGFLVTHIRFIHGGNVKYKCTLCGKAYNESPHLKGHITKVHLTENENRPPSTEFKCHKCGNTFKSRRALKKHVYEDHDKLKCNQCNKIFATVRYLQRHVLECSSQRIMQSSYYVSN